MQPVRRVAVIGTGTIGASWAAWFLARGLEVAAWDPAPDTEARVRRHVAEAWPTLERLGLAPGASPDRLSVHGDPAAAVAGAGFVQESAPERLEVKRELLARIDAAVGADAVLATSTSGILVSELQRGRRSAARMVVGHPFNPPHLIPLVEVVGGEATDPAAVDAAMAFYAAVGKRPIRLAREVPGHLVNRLQAALWREALDAVATGLASVEDVDTAIAYGPGLRWAIMGPHLTFHLAGGVGGMRHFMAHLAPALETWWADMRQPALTPELQAAVVAGVDAEARGRTPVELAAERDRALVAILETLARVRAGATG
jgi:3-hydroxyacyl-CoA dehydrogenase